MRRHLPLASAVLAGTFLVAGVALAYVRSHTDKGTAIFWPGNCTFIQPDSDGSPDLPLDTVVNTVATSIANWQNVTLKAGCSYLTINLDPAAKAEAHFDYKNVIKFRTDKWCRPGEAKNPEMCYSPQAAAITTVFYNSQPGKSSDGEIIDADIELNNIDYVFVIEPTTITVPANKMLADLENTLTHELGHFQGLDHTCWDHTQSTAPIDNMGQPIPDCADILDNPNTHKFSEAAYIKVVKAAMYNYAQPGETTKRTPKADDIQGICEIYPLASDPKTCTRPVAPKNGGCSVAQGKSAPAPLPFFSAAAALLLLAFSLRRSSRRQGSSV